MFTVILAKMDFLDIRKFLKYFSLLLRTKWALYPPLDPYPTTPFKCSLHSSSTFWILLVYMNCFKIILVLSFIVILQALKISLSFKVVLEKKGESERHRCE